MPTHCSPPCQSVVLWPLPAESTQSAGDFSFSNRNPDSGRMTIRDAGWLWDLETCPHPSFRLRIFCVNLYREGFRLMIEAQGPFRLCS